MLRNHHPRLLWTALAALALLAGAAVAQAGTSAEARADASKETPATYQIKATPEKLVLKAGGRETLLLHARAAQETSLQVAVPDAPPGLSATPAADGMKTGGKPMPIVLQASPDAKPGERVLRIAATDEKGARQETRVVVHVMAPLPFPGQKEGAKDVRPASEPRPMAAAPLVRVEPEAQRAKPGETVTYALLLQSPRNATYDLSLAQAPAGYVAELDPASVHVDAGGRAKATLTVTAPENASGATFVVQAKAREGDLRGMAKARVEVAPAPAKDAEERYPMAREARADREGPGFRAALYPRDAVVGPEGGRALVLLSGGERDQVVHLEARVREGAGWRVHVRDAVPLPAHGQAWAWVVLEPGSPSAAPLDYDLVAKGPLGRVALSGTAQVDTGRAD